MLRKPFSKAHLLMCDTDSSKRMTPLFNISRTDRILYFAPHPDDESLGGGGLIQHAVGVGAAVKVVFLTDGDRNPWAQRAAERRWTIGPKEQARWGKRR